MIAATRYPRPSFAARKRRGGRRQALLATIGIVAVFVTAFLIGNPNNLLRTPAPAVAEADGELYTGTIQLAPARGNLCRRMVFDNKTGEMHDKGSGPCAQFAANADEPERYWRSNIARVRKGFVNR